jgi:hypothetical protein
MFDHYTTIFWVLLIVFIVHAIRLTIKAEKRTSYRLSSTVPTKFILFRYDPRFFEAFIRFATNKKWSLLFLLFRRLGLGKRNGLGLKSGQFLTRNEAGGPVPFAYKEEMQKRFEHLRKHLVFTLKHFPLIDEIILIGHWNCKYYGVVPNPNNRESRELADMPEIMRAVEEILRELGKDGVKVSVWFANVPDQEKGIIEFIPAEKGLLALAH